MAFSDSLGTSCVELIPMLLTDKKIKLLTDMITNILKQDECTTAMMNDIKPLLDDIDERIVAYNDADTSTNEEIMQTLQKVIDLQTDSDTPSTLVQALGQIYNFLNANAEVDTYEVVVTTTDGLVELDLASYSFASASNYFILATVVGMSPVRVDIAEQLTDKCTLRLRDKRLWEFNPEDDDVYDGSTINVTISVAIVYTLPTIGATFTSASDEDGDGINDPETIGG